MKPQPNGRALISSSWSLFSTSFLGIAFVLLVIQFAVTPLVCDLNPTSGMTFPWSTTAEIVVGTETDLVVTIKGGKLYVGPYFVETARIDSEFQRLAGISVDRAVIVRADSTTEFGYVRTVLASARDAGYTDFKVVTFRGTNVDILARKRAV